MAKMLLGALVTLILIGALGLVWTLGGMVNVSATREHWPPVG